MKHIPQTIWETKTMEYFRIALMLIAAAIIGAGLTWCLMQVAFAEGMVRIPGENLAQKMEAAGSLVQFIDTALFAWGTRIIAGICICGAGWHLKEMRIGASIVCILAAILIGTSTFWVKNIFSSSNGPTVFGQLDTIQKSRGIS